MHSRRNAMHKRERGERKSYLGNSVRLHRPFSVRRFAYGVCLRPSSIKRITRSLREIALILARSRESQDFVGMYFSRFRR